MTNIRLNRRKIRLSKLKEELENLEQPTGVYQTMEYQQEVWDLKRKIRLLEKAIETEEQ